MTKQLTIAFQGEPGANSHIAIVEAYPGAKPLPCATFEDALGAISGGEADLGMIPIENSVAGRVADIHHLLPASGLYIVGEFFLPIRHQLMAPKGAILSDIRTVESHVHALGQCRRIIRTLGIKPIVAAEAARPVRGDRTNGVNLTQLESYIVDGTFFATPFSADVDGHPDDRGLAFALEELKFFSREFRIVGVYPAHPFRSTFSEKEE